MKTSTQLKQPVENHVTTIEMPTDFELQESCGSIIAKFSDWTSKCRIADLTDCEHDDYKEQALVIGRKIVKAVNAHDELVKALKRILAPMKLHDDLCEPSRCDCRQGQARAALAKLA